MSEDRKVENATIKKADVTLQRGFILSVSLIVAGDGWGCGYGGNFLLAHADKPTESGALLAEVIAALMKCFRVDAIGSLEGVPCRVEFNGRSGLGSKIARIGHFMKDQWVDIDEMCKPYRCCEVTK